MEVISLSNRLAMIVILLNTAPSGPPQNVSGFASSSTSVEILWSPPDFEDQNGVIRAYLLTVTETDTSNTTTYTTLNTKYMLSGLHPAYLYRCQVSAVTVAEGPLSQPIQVLTLEEGDSDIDISLYLHSGVKTSATFPIHLLSFTNLQLPLHHQVV